METVWYKKKKKLNDRRKQYCSELRNENLRCMKHGETKCPSYYQSNYYKCILQDNQWRRRERQVLDTFNMGKGLLELRAQSPEERYKIIDEEIASIISVKTNGRCQKILITLWYKIQKSEEVTSVKCRKSRNEDWLKNYKTEFCTKSVNKNPFIKEQDDTEKVGQSFLKGRRDQSCPSQGGSRNNSPIDPNRACNMDINNWNRPINMEKNNKDRSLYWEIYKGTTDNKTVNFKKVNQTKEGTVKMEPPTKDNDLDLIKEIGITDPPTTTPTSIWYLRTTICFQEIGNTNMNKITMTIWKKTIMTDQETCGSKMKIQNNIRIIF